MFSLQLENLELLHWFVSLHLLWVSKLDLDVSFGYWSMKIFLPNTQNIKKLLPLTLTFYNGYVLFFILFFVLFRFFSHVFLIWLSSHDPTDNLEEYFQNWFIYIIYFLLIFAYFLQILNLVVCLVFPVVQPYPLYTFLFFGGVGIASTVYLVIFMKETRQ